ncbi:cbb3-type cytochrome c oxidase subunit III [Steroidobacter denitrificans]|uniref:Cbb3-type cytochrome c oxidase subunit n=1 Tax=Steroidobacter denitrificans TaxID=465721 RepID=A0A127F8Y6_STEDE|nr:cytochrome-c oxidase, cbb3-type subunit III [Steroidobacter denitrificans]AMN45999.1 cbb3-type cytochrome c oxidase subunit III [Steroidobacter denitrificans]
MSTFWSAWVMFLVVLNLGITFFLFLWAPRVKIPVLPDGTTGHVWAHGALRESVRKLPTWWIGFSASMFLWGFIYLALYPGFGAFKGLLGWTSGAQLEQQVRVNDALREPILQRVRAGTVEALAGDAQVTAIGHTLFQENCAACHGSTGRGNTVLGAPNLVDDDWLYAGDGETILTSILDGRRGVMPAWGGALGREGVNQVAAYVLSLGGSEAPEDWVAAGQTHYATLCVACHGADGHGNPVLGAPNLTDDIWLYGGDFARIAETIRDGRAGEMPSLRARLGEDQARIIAAWVYAQSHAAAGNPPVDSSMDSPDGEPSSGAQPHEAG